ncbi:MAG: zinc ribbon domain-containing protein [Dehalococcoidia bacterium]|nr:zinc ribbon domain-containing protein [Dehalococcoidia bacterium]
MKAIGGLLLVIGVMGLLMNLILWLPARLSLIIMVLISAVCFVAIWGGGKLSQTKPAFVQELAKKHEPTAQQAQWVQQKVACPKCGCQVVPGQQFCGACGSSLASYCATCGGAITTPSKFCGNCGARLV